MWFLVLLFLVLVCWVVALALRNKLTKYGMLSLQALVIVLSFIPIVSVGAILFFTENMQIGLRDIRGDQWMRLFGSLLSYAGVCTLGLISYWQNQKLSQANRDLVSLQLDNYIPLLSIVDSSTTFENLNVENHDLLKATKSISKSSRWESDFPSEDAKTAFNTKFDEINSLEEQLKLFRSMPTKTTESFYCTHWFLLDEKGRFVENGHTISVAEWNQQSLKIEFRNENKSKIKRIIFDEIELKLGKFKWKFIPQPNKNCISDLLLPEKKLNFFINLFWHKEDKLLGAIMEHFSSYDIVLDVTLVTIGDRTQKEKISSSWVFGNIIETNYKLLQ